MGGWDPFSDLGSFGFGGGGKVANDGKASK